MAGFLLVPKLPAWERGFGSSASRGGTWEPARSQLDVGGFADRRRRVVGILPNPVVGVGGHALVKHRPGKPQHHRQGLAQAHRRPVENRHRGERPQASLGDQGLDFGQGIMRRAFFHGWTD